MAITGLKSSRDFLRIWFYWKRAAIVVFCLIVVSICFYSFSQTPIYETSAKILLLPKTNDELVVSAGKGSRQYDIRSIDDNDINTEIQLIRSREVVNNTASYFSKHGSETTLEVDGQDDMPLQTKFDSTQINKNNKTLNVLSSMVAEPIYSSNMILVSLSSPNQKNVADVLNKHLEMYVRYHKQMNMAEESEAFYDDQKKYYATRLKDARDKLNDFNRANNIVNMESELSANMGLVSSFNEQLQNLEILIAENEARMAMLKDGLRIDGDQMTISKEMRSMPVIVELARGLVPLLIKRTEISKTFTKESREYQQIDDQIAMLRQEIKNEGLNATRTDHLENQTLKTKRDALKKRLAEIKEQMRAFPQVKQQLNALEMDLEIARNNYLLYGSKTEDSRLYADRNKSGLSNVIIAETAVMPTKAKSPNKLLAFEVAIFLGLFAAFILPFILETVDQKLKNAEDIEAVLSLPVVCSYNELK